MLQELSSLDEKLEKLQKAEERATKQRASVKLTARPACLRRLPNCSMSCRQAGPEAQQSLKPGDKLRVLRHSQKLRHRTKPQPLRCNVMLQRPRPKQPPKSTTCLRESLQQHRQLRRQPSKMQQKRQLQPRQQRMQQPKRLKKQLRPRQRRKQGQPRRQPPRNGKRNSGS